MTARERREKLKELLLEEQQAVTAAQFAARFSVSRQVIVADIALLRTGGMEIDSTPRGYMIHQDLSGTVHKIVCSHDGEDKMVEELNTIVDYGCKVLDVIIEHPIYGRLTGELHIESRYDVQLFAKKVSEYDAMPLSALTDGTHIHTIMCSSEEGYECLVKELTQKGILISSN